MLFVKVRSLIFNRLMMHDDTKNVMLVCTPSVALSGSLAPVGAYSNTPLLLPGFNSADLCRCV